MSHVHDDDNDPVFISELLHGLKSRSSIIACLHQLLSQCPPTLIQSNLRSSPLLPVRSPFQIQID